MDNCEYESHCSIKLLTGNSNPELARGISERLGIPIARAEARHFADGEVCVDIYDTVRNCDVFIIQSTCPPVNDSLMELLLLIDACKRASAGRIFAVIPYYGYARQDRKARPREPIAAKLVADMLTVAGCSAVLTMDLHARQIQGFFDIPVDHLVGVPVLAQHYLDRHFQGSDLVVVSPDLGSVSRARSFANRLGAPMAIIDKRRPEPNKSEVMNIIGEIRDKRTIIIDDLIDTGGTFFNCANALKERGAKEIYACATHGVLSNDAAQRFQDSVIKELVILDTIPLPENKRLPKIRVLTAADIFARAIHTIIVDDEMSKLTEN